MNCIKSLPVMIMLCTISHLTCKVIRSDQSTIPQLPHIPGAMPLTPIGEASREGTRMTIPISLPPIEQDKDIDGEKSFIKGR
jgi:hypothetical protein